MSLAAPVRYTPAVEEIQPDERETIQGLNDTFDTILETTAKEDGHAVRSVHAKAHAILEGRMVIADGLPPELAQGLFARPGEHRVLMRISTNAGDILPDTISLPRGLALKVLDVEGERLPGAQGTTQDFIMVNGPMFQAKTADKFLGNLKMLAATTNRMEGVKEAMSGVARGLNTVLSAVGIESTKLQSLGGAPNVDPMGETYYSVTPFRYGDYIAKFSIVPVAPALLALKDKEIDATDNPDAIRDTVRSEMQGIDGVWEFRVQLCRDLERQPVEDPTVQWDEDEAPFRTVATITIPRQDSWEPARVQAVNEEMHFMIWTGLAAHQPLGNINRARREAYLHSTRFRERFNRCPVHEPGTRSAS
ncbi:catalase family protein [Pararoseomonas indoligenes]|uniref:Catalase family protein n=1 Tax=Roseomonas indoligenes TaxID=2820811 RepID=A0A940N624_9PROT|nr:catalase family protein [Pararoseomonas indoligenes]MBP0495770.1 catalase family protein [Pararoseomonas indoligenes]